jgi:hypothetical protein
MTTNCHAQSIARPADTPAEPARFDPVRLDVADADADPGADRRVRSTIEGTL